MLSELEAEIITAAHGADALTIVKSQPVETIISDINMPVMDGLELLRQLRKDGYEIPFILVTAFGEKQKMLEALRLGAMDFIEKPFKNEAILAIAGKALEFGMALRELENELERLFTATQMPLEEVMRIKNMKRAMIRMKMESDIYASKKVPSEDE